MKNKMSRDFSNKCDRTRKWIALTLWEGFKFRIFKQLTDTLADPLVIFDDPSILNKFAKLNSKSFSTDDLLEKAEIICNLSRSKGFGILTFDNEEYPRLLKTISSPPPVLFFRGNEKFLNMPAIAVVGTRNPTPYGLDVTRELVHQLTDHGVVVVSGLALGIDALAHAISIEKGGNTIAVLGCGLDQKYPVSNQQIRSNIEKKGLVITEFDWGTPPRPGQYPQRNRIISGISLGVVIVEARKTSGALITINHALDQGREVFAVPGPITSPASQGPLMLIQQGATPLLNVRDIFDQLPSLGFPKPNTNKIALSDKHSAIHIEPQFERIWELISDQAVAVDDLIAKSGLPAHQVQTGLLELELKGYIKCLPGNCVRRSTEF
ncbi:DNA-processing protein DprA [bacterium]|nr:DNA-processing protein DprA [candidate division CSSED10-310 bacterium]